jgi:hypothetical protein
MKWTKLADDRWICVVPPDGRFTLKATRKGDLRWTWQIFTSGADNAMASGIVTTIGDAKHAMEQFLKKKGFV